ncbi:integrase, catalytic region, zinc finger, CCHC-type containing protein [Tanacetum coccineum]
MIPKTERLQEYRRLQVVSYGINYVARPLLLFFSSENQLLWFSEVQEQIRRIFLDGYGVLDVRTVIFKCLRLSFRICAFLLIFTKINDAIKVTLFDVITIVNHRKVAKGIWGRVKLLMQGTKLSLQEKECLAIPMFNPGDDPIACLNKAMAFLTAVTSSSYKGNATSSGGNNTGGQARVVKCYNCQGEGHMARQCIQPKRPWNAAWFKENAMLAEDQEAGKFLDEEKLAFLSDPRILDGQAVQTTIPNNAAFHTEDLDAYDSDCDDVSNAKAVLMDNLSSDSNIISYS